MKQTNYAVELSNATLQRGARTLWNKLDLAIKPGEFIAILGPNGAGKTTLLKVLLGLEQLTHGSVTVLGEAAQRKNQQIGYIPQQKNFDRNAPIRGRDLVKLGTDGTSYGITAHTAAQRARINEAIAAVGADAYADVPIGLLSGGEQQRLRIAQALVSQPQILLCDEPLLSLDMAAQANVTKLINDYRLRNQAAVLFVTHEINPVLPYVDRVLYLANGKWVVDTPEKVLQSKTLSDLYGTQVEVLHVKNRILVVGAEDVLTDGHEAHHGEHA